MKKSDKNAKLQQIENNQNLSQLVQQLHDGLIDKSTYLKLRKHLKDLQKDSKEHTDNSTDSDDVDLKALNAKSSRSASCTSNDPRDHSNVGSWLSQDTDHYKEREESKEPNQHVGGIHIHFELAFFLTVFSIP
jgi:hypothetical protein